MNIECFFSSPGEKCEIEEKLLDDLYNAKDRILVTAYSLQAHVFINAINDSTVKEKLVVLNDDNIALNSEHIRKTVLGLNRQGLELKMHNKFIIIDNIVWTGSFNLSGSAIIKNWENMIRVESEEVANKFTYYFKKMFVWESSINSLPIITYHHPKLECPECNSNIQDIMEHYQIDESEETPKCISKMYPAKGEYCNQCNQYKKMSELVVGQNDKIICIDCYV